MNRQDQAVQQLSEGIGMLKSARRSIAFAIDEFGDAALAFGKDGHPIEALQDACDKLEAQLAELIKQAQALRSGPNG